VTHGRLLAFDEHELARLAQRWSAGDEPSNDPHARAVAYARVAP
jgi:hypothetical protein